MTTDPQPTPPDRAKVEAILSKLPPDLATRLRGLYNKWLDPENNTLKESEIKELRAYGLIPDINGIGNLEPNCSRGECAKRLTNDLGKPVNKVLVSQRVKHQWKDLVTSDNLVNYAELKRRWTGGEVVEAGGTSVNLDLERAQRQRIAKEREQMALDRERRKYDSSWMLTIVCAFFSDSFGVTLKNLWRDMFERVLWGMVESAVKEIIADEALCQKLLEILRPMFPAAFDQLQAEMASKLDELTREAEEMNQKQKEEMK